MDLALGEDIDMHQYRYFANVVEQRMGDTDQAGGRGLGDMGARQGVEGCGSAWGAWVIQGPGRGSGGKGVGGEWATRTRQGGVLSS